MMTAVDKNLLATCERVLNWLEGPTSTNEEKQETARWLKSAIDAAKRRAGHRRAPGLQAELDAQDRHWRGA